MPEGYPTLESQVPYYVAVKDQGAEPSVPSRLALRKNHYIESTRVSTAPPGGEASTSSIHQEVKRSTSPGAKRTWNQLHISAYVTLLDLLIYSDNYMFCQYLISSFAYLTRKGREAAPESATLHLSCKLKKIHL